jgi:UDP-GlcNAc:undecaprenyl-phosphate/decaprenyl-phosphate GlcNAc-1-phosphate transferase
VSWLPAIAFAASLAVSWLFTLVTLRAAPALGLMDHPDQRKDHRQPVPKGGGLAICAALLLTLSGSLIGGAAVRDFAWIELLGVVLVVVGLVDDFRPVAWQLRLAVQMLLATVVIVGPLSGLDAWVRLLAWFWIVGLTNAFNMLDNMDALSGGVAFITAAFLAVAIAMRYPQEAAEGPALVPHLAFMGAVLGFLWFNRPPARIFMGDAGSTYLGFVLAVRALGVGPGAGESPALWLAPVCIFAVPCYDLLSVVLLRLWQRRSPFQADHQHLSHRLVLRGLRSTTAVRVIYLFANASGCSGLIILAAPAPWLAGLVVLQVGLWWGALAVIECRTRRPAVDQTPTTRTSTVAPDEAKRVG